MENKYNSQKKYLKTKKQLRVWTDEEKYNNFQKVIEDNGESIYSVINKYMDSVILNNKL